MRSSTRTSGSCWAATTCMVIDTRSTHVQGARDPRRPARADDGAGDGRRRHARPLRPRLRQPRLPAGADLGSRAAASRSWSGPARRARRGSPTEMPGDRRRPRRGRHRPARPDVRRDRLSSTSATAGSSCGSSVAATPTTTSSSGSRTRASCSPATCSRTAPCRAFGDGYPLDWPETAFRVAELAPGVVVPGHGDHGGAGVRRRAGRVAFIALAELARRVHTGDLTLDDAVAATPFPAYPAEDVRRPLERALAAAPRRARLTRPLPTPRSGRSSGRGRPRRRSRRAPRRACRA